MNRKRKNMTPAEKERRDLREPRRRSPKKRPRKRAAPSKWTAPPRVFQAVELPGLRNELEGRLEEAVRFQTQADRRAPSATELRLLRASFVQQVTDALAWWDRTTRERGWIDGQRRLFRG